MATPLTPWLVQGASLIMSRILALAHFTANEDPVSLLVIVLTYRKWIGVLRLNICDC